MSPRHPQPAPLVHSLYTADRGFSLAPSPSVMHIRITGGEWALSSRFVLCVKAQDGKSSAENDASLGAIAGFRLAPSACSNSPASLNATNIANSPTLRSKAPCAVSL